MNFHKEKVYLVFVILPTLTALLFFGVALNQDIKAFAQTQDNPRLIRPPSFPSSSTLNTTVEPSATSGENHSSSELTYENPSAGVKVTYPSDWMDLGPYKDEFINIIASFQGSVDKHGLPIIQILSKSPEGSETKSVDDYANTFFKNEEKNKEGYKIEEIETDGVTVNGRPGYKAVVTYNICVAQDCAGEERRGKMLEVGTMNDKGEIIAINYDAYESDYPKFLPIAQKMIDSLELK